MCEIVQNNSDIPKWKILNATNIKIIAIVLMFLDHIHQMYVSVGAPLWLKMLGRPVFVMFLFLAAESFYYTRSRKKYLMRLLFASWIMTIVSYMIGYFFPNPEVVLMNNAFSTFFVTGIYMQCWDWFIGGIKQKQPKMIVKSILIALIPILLSAIPIFISKILLLIVDENFPFIIVRIIMGLSMFIPTIVTVEGGFIFVIMGLLLYIFRNKRILQIIVLLIISAMVYLINRDGIQWMMCFAVIPMILYNGQRGRNMKNFFYVFYPLHIWILYLIATIF